MVPSEAQVHLNSVQTRALPASYVARLSVRLEEFEALGSHIKSGGGRHFKAISHEGVG